uniref:Uncharacterized protein n=1 Tax=Sipha flava TaxID=143950 RepID=A0A2S2Q5E5_9HEMI
MVGSMVDNAVVGKKIKHAAPALNKLISSSSFVIDFDACKFLNIGLDCSNDFNVLHIIVCNRIDVCYMAQSYARVPKHLIRDNSNFIVLFKQDETNLKHAYS